jgi:hypothetical protein
MSELLPVRRGAITTTFWPLSTSARRAAISSRRSVNWVPETMSP